MKFKFAVLAALCCGAFAMGCSSTHKKDTPAPAAAAPAAAPGCTSDAQCASAGACAKCVAGQCKQEFGPTCCDKDSDCGNPALRCRANMCK